MISYKIFGIVLMALTFPAVIFAAIAAGGDPVEWVVLVLPVFALGFFPGLFFYRQGKEMLEPGKLVKYARRLMIIGLAIMLFAFSVFFIACLGSCDPLGVGLFAITIGTPGLVLYCVGVLLLIVHKVIERKRRGSQ